MNKSGWWWIKDKFGDFSIVFIRELEDVILVDNMSDGSIKVLDNDVKLIEKIKLPDTYVEEDKQLVTKNRLILFNAAMIFSLICAIIFAYVISDMVFINKFTFVNSTFTLATNVGILIITSIMFWWGLELQMKIKSSVEPLYGLMEEFKNAGVTVSSFNKFLPLINRIGLILDDIPIDKLMYILDEVVKQIDNIPDKEWDESPTSEEEINNMIGDNFW